MKRIVLLSAVLVLACTSMTAQRLSVDSLYIKTGASVGGAVLYAPTLAADKFFWFPPEGGMLLTTANFGGWLVGGQDLSATGLLGSHNGYDVSVIAGGITSIRMTFLNSTAAIVMPARTELRFADVAGGEYTAIKAPQVQPTNVTLVLPYYKPLERGQRLQVDSVNGDTVVLGYTTEETSTDVSFDTKQNATETNAGPIDVPDMVISVLPNKTYAFEALISVQHPVANANASVSFALPAGASLHYYRLDLTLNNPQAGGNLTEAAEIYAAPAAPAEKHYILHGFVRTTAAGGVVQMRLATTSPGDIIRLTENSFMQITTN